MNEQIIEELKEAKAENEQLKMQIRIARFMQHASYVAARQELMDRLQNIEKEK